MDERMTRLWRRLKYGGERTARDELVLAHLPLVRYILGRLPVTLPAGLGQEDMASVGVVALMRAVDDFDPERGVEFATFAVPRIRGAMFDELRAQDIVPRSVRRRASAIDRACVALQRDDGAAPSVEEIGQETGLKPEEVERTLSAVGLRSLLSLEGFVRSAPGGREQKILEGAADRTVSSPLGAVLAKERCELLMRAIAALPEADRRVITLYYQHDLMLKEIAEVLSVTKSRVSQIHTRALFRLRSHIAEAMARRPTAGGEGVS